MIIIALALIILVAYIATLICMPCKMKIQIGKLSWFVKFTTEDKSGDA